MLFQVILNKYSYKLSNYTEAFNFGLAKSDLISAKTSTIQNQYKDAVGVITAQVVHCWY